MSCENCVQSIDLNGGDGNSLQGKKSAKCANAFGIAGFVLSLYSVLLGIAFLFFPIVSLTINIIGVVNIKKCNTVNWMAILGLIISVIALAFWMWWWITVLTI